MIAPKVGKPPLHGSGASRAESSLARLWTQAVLRQGISGAVGGALVFLLLEGAYIRSGWRDDALFGASEQTFQNWLPGLPAASLFLPGVLFAAVVTALLVFADDRAAGHRSRAGARALAAALAGSVVGAGYSVIAHAVFASLRSTVSGGGAEAGLLRAFVWSSFGLGVGLSAGIASRSMRRAYQGCAGGLIGGFAGGLLFALALGLSGSGSLSRLCGFTALGLCVGIATALAEQLSRSAWLLFLTGPQEGRQVTLHGEEVVMGRDEWVDVPLFGDPAVESRAACIRLEPEPMIQETALSPLLRVNGLPVCRSALADGDVIQIGTHRLRFRCRALPGVGAPVPPHATAYLQYPDDPYPHDPYPHDPYPHEPDPQGLEPNPLYPAPDEPAFKPDPTMSDLSTAAAASAAYHPEMPLVLRVMAGSTKDVVVRLQEGGLTIGRELGNGLPLPDPKVSRFHARIERIDGCWVLTDLGSTNGTRLNGLTIARAGLVPGDFIYLGDTVLGVEKLGG